MLCFDVGVGVGVFGQLLGVSQDGSVQVLLRHQRWLEATVSATAVDEGTHVITRCLARLLRLDRDVVELVLVLADAARHGRVVCLWDDLRFASKTKVTICGDRRSCEWRLFLVAALQRVRDLGLLVHDPTLAPLIPQTSLPL